MQGVYSNGKYKALTMNQIAKKSVDIADKLIEYLNK